MYKKGQGVPQDYKTAVKWYTLAAEQGNRIAQVKLGDMYAEGVGVPQDYKIAVKWLFASYILLMIIVSLRYAWQIVHVLKHGAPLSPDESMIADVTGNKGTEG